jgi:uncharacterized protein YkwD
MPVEKIGTATEPVTPAFSLRLRQIATGLLCVAALGAAVRSSTAQAETPEPSLSDAVPIEQVNPASADTTPTLADTCGDPAYRAPRQLQTDSMLCRLNQVRVNPLIWDAELEEAARQKIEDIMNCQSWSHIPCPEDTNPFTHIEEDKELVDPWVIGENLAYGKGGFASVRALFAAWRKSPSHWDNIENERYTSVGIAAKHFGRIVMDGIPRRNITIWATEFLGH